MLRAIYARPINKNSDKKNGLRRAIPNFAPAAVFLGPRTLVHSLRDRERGTLKRV